MTGEALPVIPEKQGVVVGGPLDPTSAEGQPPEGQTVNPSQSTDSSGEPFYKGFGVEVKTPEELKAYAKKIEGELIEAKIAAQIKAPVISTTPITQAPSVTGKERFEETVFSKPGDAYEILKADAKAEIRQEMANQKAIQDFWNRFYEKHQDLKQASFIVQSIVEKRFEEIKTKSESDLDKFLVEEANKIIGPIRKSSGYTETSIPSGNAVAFGGSKEPIPAPPQRPAVPQNFVDQIRGNRPRPKK